MKVYIIMVAIEKDYIGGGEEYIDSGYFAVDKAERQVQISSNDAVNDLREPTDPDEPIDQPKVTFYRGHIAKGGIFQIRVESTDGHIEKSYYIREIEIKE